MTPVLSTVTIVSDNPAYPQNKVTITVDNDISSDTVVVPNTTFPFIIEFLNCPEAVGKRYISERFFDQLSNSETGAYLTDRGKIYSTLQKGFTIYPYITLDYKIFIDKVQNERAISIIERGVSIPILDYVGASISSFEEISPILLLQWLDLPVNDGEGLPINSFPLILGYTNKKPARVNSEIVEKEILDFFANTYFVKIDYSDDVNSSKTADENYDNYVNNAESLFDGKNSKKEKFNKLKDKSKKKTLSTILESVAKISGTILGSASLIAAAASLKEKLAAAKIKKPSIPSIPNIGFSKLLIFKKTKKSEEKTRKKKRLSGKKKIVKPPVPPPPIPAVEKLKKKSGTLKNSAIKRREQSLAKQQSVNMISPTLSSSTSANTVSNMQVASYVVSTSVNGDTILVTVTNNFGKPSFTKSFSAITFTTESAKDSVEFELNNFGASDPENGFYPKSGSPI